MGELSAKTRKYAIGGSLLFFLIAIAMGAVSMFYIGWIKYRVVMPDNPTEGFTKGRTTEFFFHSRHRGLFYFTVDDAKAVVVEKNNGNRYFPVMYNYNTTIGNPNLGFWSITVLMKISVGLHVAYLACMSLAAWLITFSGCLGRKLSYLSTGLAIIGLIAGGIGLAAFHTYLGMEKTSDIKALPHIYHNWPTSLQSATGDTIYIGYGIHIGSFGAGVLALLLALLLATSWEAKRKESGSSTDKVNKYVRDNTAYDDSLMDKPARAELWNGFDRVSDRRSSERKLRAHYDYGPSSSGSLKHPSGHQHHHHHHTIDRPDMEYRPTTPTRQHYHNEPNNYPIRY